MTTNVISFPANLARGHAEIESAILSIVRINNGSDASAAMLTDRMKPLVDLILNRTFTYSGSPEGFSEAFRVFLQELCEQVLIERLNRETDVMFPAHNSSE